MGNAAAGVQECMVEHALSGDEVVVTDDNIVLLNVYDLSTEWLQANELLSDVLNIGGAFHTGVEVYGREYIYGSDGITAQQPRCHDVHVYRQSIVVGRTDLNAHQVSEMIGSEMAIMWRPEDYSLLSHNCCSFARDLCARLTGEDIPDWVDRLAQIVTDNGLEGMVSNVLCGDALGVRRYRSTDTCTTVASGTSEETATPRYAVNMIAIPFGHIVPVGMPLSVGAA
eukprot:TRINITY_DN64367_c0_g1_i1.p1 TRINITY_DN64367_c0_g1~~TRINITY_DN64367_c0_g1_i1.p1  ORF type:complete len:226 (-),score=28.39 TRINITY_DN64367_c0_g1_i1:42-719(-)